MKDFRGDGRSFRQLRGAGCSILPRMAQAGWGALEWQPKWSPSLVGVGQYAVEHGVEGLDLSVGQSADESSVGLLCDQDQSTMDIASFRGEADTGGPSIVLNLAPT